MTDADVLTAVRRHWAPEVDEVTYLAVGWGAHHWRADAAGDPVLFVTLDIPLPRHTAASLEGAYASAAALAGELAFVWPSLPSADGPFTVAMSWGRLSVTRWLEGERPASSSSDLEAMLAALHAAPPPGRAPRWTSIVEPDLLDRLRSLLQQAWDGPLGPSARDLVVEHLAQVTGWSREHAFLLGRADPSSYVVTHGEPGVHNQWLAGGATYVLDWESLALAPRERDLVTLLQEGRDVDHDPGLVRLFDLEWRLSEISSFAQWLQQPHVGDADDRTALGGLTHELTRPHAGS